MILAVFFPLPQVKQAVIWALQAGYRHIDCAAIYGNEAEIGEALHESVGPGKVNPNSVPINWSGSIIIGHILLWLVEVRDL